MQNYSLLPLYPTYLAEFVVGESFADCRFFLYFAKTNSCDCQRLVFLAAF